MVALLQAMNQSALARGLKMFLAAWGCAAVIGTAHHVIQFRSGLLLAVGSSVFLPLLGALVGPLVGLGSGAPFFTWDFKLGLAAALVVSVALVVVGVRGEASWWRWLTGIAGVLLWMVAGLVGFGPQ